MALSDDQIVNIWGREPRYHAAPIGSTDIAFARAIEAEARRDALEEAAKECESMHEEDRPGDYAYAIRKLKEDTQ